MTPEETAALFGLIKQVCPTQRYDDYTLDGWYFVLGDLVFEDAREAVRRLARRRPFIGTADVYQEVQAIRRARFDAAESGGGIPLPSDVDEDDVEGLTRARQRDVRAIKDGTARVVRDVTGARVVLHDEPPPRAIKARGRTGANERVN